MESTLIIIIVTAIFSISAFSNSNQLNKWINWPYYVVHQKQYIRLLTSGFIHADWTHLIFNMLTLYFFGTILEQFLSLPVYLLLYLSAIIVSDIPTVLKHKDNVNYRSLGASGGVSAILFGSIILYPLNNIYLFFIPIGIPGFIFGFLYLAYTYWQDKRSADHINHSAHLIGALYGIIAVLLLIPGSGRRFVEQISTFNPFS